MKKYYFLFFCFLLTAFSAGCSPAVKEKYRETKTLMGTFVQVDICYDRGSRGRLEAAYADVWERLEEIHWRMSIFQDPSDVTSINRSYRNPVEVGADTYRLIERAMYYSRMSGGRFDITVGPLVQLWRKAREEGVLPPDEEIRSAREITGPQNIRLLPGNRVEILDPRTRLDLGAIAKGYAVDETARILREHGFKDFFIDAGGDVYVGGMSCENRLWRVGIAHPRIAGRLIAVVELTDMAVLTSGDYQQFREIGGKRYGHIIDPSTGWPAGGPVSATVIAPSATDADALSTALSVMPPEEGVRLIDGLEEGYASMSVTEGAGGELREHESRRFSRYREKSLF